MSNLHTALPRSRWLESFAVLALSTVIASGCGRHEATEERAPGVSARPESVSTQGRPELSGIHVAGRATIEGRSGNTLTGTAVFTPAAEGGVTIVVDLKGAPPGVHGIHLHQVGDCSAPDAKSAGDHYNPTGQQHGGPTSAQHHAGDFGNIEVAADGTGHFEIRMPELTIDQVRDRAIVIHADRDDETTQPSGNSGARIGCGVVAVLAEDATSPTPAHGSSSH